MHVVVWHVQAGKGRTGIMICCLLLYLHKNAPDLANLPAASPAAAAAALGAAHEQRQHGNSSSSRLQHPWQCVAPVELRRLEQPVRDVLDLYAERRTHDGNGVTIKSQRRCGVMWFMWCLL